MTVIESIVQGVKALPLKEQVEVARLVHRLTEQEQQRREEVLRRTHGVLDEVDGQLFQEAMESARQVEANG